MLGFDDIGDQHSPWWVFRLASSILFVWFGMVGFRWFFVSRLVRLFFPAKSQREHSETRAPQVESPSQKKK